MPGQSTMVWSTSRAAMTIRLARTAEMSSVSIHREMVTCGRSVRPCLWPEAGTAWPLSTTSSTPLGAATTTRTPPSALTSCRWSPTTHATTSGHRCRRCCCPTARRGFRSGRGRSTYSEATAGRTWPSPEPLRCTTLTKVPGPEGLTCQNVSQERQRACAR